MNEVEIEQDELSLREEDERCEGSDTADSRTHRTQEENSCEEAR